LDYLATHTSLSPIQRGFAPGFVNYKIGCTRLTAASDKVYQLLAHGRWFSPGTPASSTTKTGRHDIAGILLKVALNTKNQNQILCNQLLPPLKFVSLICEAFSVQSLCDKHCQLLVGGLYYFPGTCTVVSYPNNYVGHNKIKILLKMMLSTP
jgi:hypothetical protein